MGSQAPASLVPVVPMWEKACQKINHRSFFPSLIQILHTPTIFFLKTFVSLDFFRKFAVH